MAVALRAHPPLPDGLRAPQPGGERVRIEPEDDHLGRLQPAVAQGRVGDEAAEPASDDRDGRVHCGKSYLTEPASSPSTK